MNVTTRLNLTPATVVSAASLATATDAAAPAASPQAAPKAEEPKESSALSRAVRAGMRKGASWGDNMSTTVGGATGLVVTGLVGYGMTIGGATVGALIGGGLGPVLAAISGAGPLGIIGGAFAAAGTMAKAGMILGGVTGVLGGWKLGTAVGGTVAGAVGAVPGFVVGAAQGLAGKETPPPPVKEKKPEAPPTELRGVLKPTAQVVSGVSTLSGAVGGFVVGGTLAAAGSLAHTAISQAATFSQFAAALPTTALIGGAIGAALLGYIGGKGGLQLTKAAQWTWDKTGGKLLENRRPTGKVLKENRERLEAREQDLNQRAAAVKTGSETLRTEHKAASERLAKEEDRVAGEEQTSGAELKVVETRIEDRGQAGFRDRAAKPDAALDAKGDHAIIGKRNTLDQWSGQLNNWKGTLDDFDARLQKWEAGLDQKIDKGAADIFREERKPIDEHFGGLRKELDAFEQRLNEYEAKIRSEIQSKFGQRIGVEKPPVEAEVRSARSEANSAENERSRAQSSANAARSSLSAAEAAAASARNELNRAESENSSLRNDINRLRARISELDSAIARER